jgi:hypothetical protein
LNAGHSRSESRLIVRKRLKFIILTVSGDREKLVEGSDPTIVIVADEEKMVVLENAEEKDWDDLRKQILRNGGKIEAERVYDGVRVG